MKRSLVAIVSLCGVACSGAGASPSNDADEGGASQTLPTVTPDGSAKDGGGSGGDTPDGGDDSGAPPVVTWDPREPGPNELFTAKDGSSDYLHSVIPDGPKLDSNSSAIVGGVDSAPRLNGPEWQMTIYMAKNSDPSYHPSLSNADDWGCSVGDSIHIPDYGTRELPGDGDGWIIVANKEDDTVKSIWVASKSGKSWSGSCGGSYKLSGNGTAETKLAGVGVGSEVQAGFGFIQYSELQAGAINHALYFTSTKSCSKFRKPAAKSDGDSSGDSCVPMGARLQLDPEVDCSGLSGASKGEKMICKTMQRYGGYVLDSGGSGPISGIGIAGDDLTDPGRAPWKTPGNGMRGSRGCSKVGDNCGIVSHAGLDGSSDALSHIPWDKLRVLASWNGK